MELSRPTPRDVQYPAYAALLRSGMLAVPIIIGQLKQPTAEDRKDSFRLRLLAGCLAAIYDEGGNGQEMARHRIELEMPSATETEKKALGDALKFSELK